MADGSEHGFTGVYREIVAPEQTLRYPLARSGCTLTTVTAPYRYFYQTDLVKLAETIRNRGDEHRLFLDDVVNNANYHDFTDDGKTVVKIPASDDNAAYRKIVELERASGFTCGPVDGMT